jgi:hypothetical protein
MKRCVSCWLMATCAAMFMLLSVSSVGAQETIQMEDGVFRWGGSGYDSSRLKGSTRFLARSGATDDPTRKATVEIVVDTIETWQDLTKLFLASPDSRVLARSVSCGKSHRHIEAPWICIFLVEDVLQLPDEGLIVAKDETGKEVLSEKTDLRPIKAIISAAGGAKAKLLSKKTNAGDGK